MDPALSSSSSSPVVNVMARLLGSAILTTVSIPVLPPQNVGVVAGDAKATRPVKLGFVLDAAHGYKVCWVADVDRGDAFIRAGSKLKARSPLISTPQAPLRKDHGRTVPTIDCVAAPEITANSTRKEIAMALSRCCLWRQVKKLIRRCIVVAAFALGFGRDTS